MKTVQFVCSNCGASFFQWFGKCPECNEWNTLKEFATAPSRTKQSPAVFSRLGSSGAKSKLPSGSHEVDRVLSGGFGADAVALLSGQPGIGKSTLLLHIAAHQEGVLYCSGEEESEEIAQRAGRIKKNSSILFSSEKDIDALIAGIGEVQGVKMVIFDSLQTLTVSGSSSGLQVKEVLTRIITAAKQMHFVALVVGHVTKEGDIAGPKYLEHMVDTVLLLEGDPHSSIRILRCIKNRYGPTTETGFFTLENGIQEVRNPSEFFMDTRPGPGKATVAVREGSRIIFATIEALAVPTSLAFPKRVAKGIDTKRFELILAILKKHVHAPVDRYDMYANVSGGLRITDPLADFGIAAAVLSALSGKPTKAQSVFTGELGLLGQLRVGSGYERIESEARRIGFQTIYSPKDTESIGWYTKRNE